MDKSLFNNDFTYTKDASNLDKEVTNVLRPIINKYIILGYSPREIAYVIFMAIDMTHLEFVLENIMKEN